jgi:hypothetical protein
MTQQKKLKKAIRARSRKTGESYTAARRHIVEAGRKTSTPAGPIAAPAVAPAPGRGGTKVRTRTGEAGLIKKTGHGYDHWFAVLDAFDAPAKGHTASAAHLYRDHGVPSWHCQMVTVAYERERGLRAMNQSCAGDFQVNISKVVPASVADVVDVLRSPRRRAAWLKAADPALGRALEAAVTAANPRQVKVRDSSLARLRYPWGGEAVEIAIMGKPNGRTSVVASMTKLAGPDEVEERRAQWREALEGLKGYLTS